MTLKENNIWHGQSMESLLSDVLEIYREIGPLQEKINEIYEKAKEKMNTTVYEDEWDKKSDKDYFKCIESYACN